MQVPPNTPVLSVQCINFFSMSPPLSFFPGLNEGLAVFISLAESPPLRSLGFTLRRACETSICDNPFFPLTFCDPREVSSLSEVPPLTFCACRYIAGGFDVRPFCRAPPLFCYGSPRLGTLSKHPQRSLCRFFLGRLRERVPFLWRKVGHVGGT